MFFYFFSAFNTIRPPLWGGKLTAMEVDACLVSWIVYYLTGRQQYVCLQHCVSDRVVSNTGAPEGTVLSPFLFNLYTTALNYCTETCHLYIFSGLRFPSRGPVWILWRIITTLVYLLTINWTGQRTMKLSKGRARVISIF